MKIELENKDLDILAEKVAKQIEERMSQQTVWGKLEEKLKTLVNHHAEYYLAENTLKHDVKDVIKLIVADYLKTTDTIENSVADYFNSESFKQISIRQLERRIESIKREIELEQETED